MTAFSISFWEMAVRKWTAWSRRLSSKIRMAAFRNITFAAGFPLTGKSHGINLADLFGDGRLSIIIAAGGAYPGDILTTNVFYPKALAGNYLNVRVDGTVSNRSAIGAWWRLRPAGESSTGRFRAAATSDVCHSSSTSAWLRRRRLKRWKSVGPAGWCNAGKTCPSTRRYGSPKGSLSGQTFMPKRTRKLRQPMLVGQTPRSARVPQNPLPTGRLKFGDAADAFSPWTAQQSETFQSSKVTPLERGIEYGAERSGKTKVWRATRRLRPSAGPYRNEAFAQPGYGR